MKYQTYCRGKVTANYLIAGSVKSYAVVVVGIFQLYSIHITLHDGSSDLPPLEVVVMPAVFAMSSKTSLHSYIIGRSASVRTRDEPEILKSTYLARQRATFAIPVTPHLLRYFKRFLRIYECASVKRLVIFGSSIASRWLYRSAIVFLTANVSLEAQQNHRQ